MLLNGAYLVEREREREFEEAVARCGSSGERGASQLELTGPWPPYNFVSTAAMVMP